MLNQFLVAVRRVASNRGESVEQRQKDMEELLADAEADLSPAGAQAIRNYAARQKFAPEFEDWEVEDWDWESEDEEDLKDEWKPEPGSLSLGVGHSGDPAWVQR